eukprot:COSAG02_NODE_1328_length_13219_cov_45.612652_2_plen_128_part_00
MLRAAGVHDEASWFAQWMDRVPYCGQKPRPDDRYTPIALMLLDLVRSEIDTQSEAVIACAAITLHIVSFYRPSVAKALWDDGFLDVRSSNATWFTSRASVSSSLMPSRPGIPSLVVSIQSYRADHQV